MTLKWHKKPSFYNEHDVSLKEPFIVFRLKEQTENEKISIEKNKELMRQKDLEEKKVQIREMVSD